MSIAWKTGILAGVLTFVVLFFLDILFPGLPAFLQVSSNAIIAFLAMATAYTVFSQKDS